jgi:AraC family ethanolamine operon transcriptional activator
MLVFDDFDAWGDAVSGASLQMACDAVDTGTWSLGVVDLGGVVLQVASEGGGNVCYGGSTHPGTTLFIPLMHTNGHVVNGENLDDDSLFLIGRGADFRISVRRRAHTWCSIALPSDAASPIAPAPASSRNTCPAGTLPKLKRLVGEIAGTLMDRPSVTAAHQAAGRELISLAHNCLPAETPPAVACGRPRLDRTEIIRRSMNLIDATVIMPTTTDLAREVGVTSRTLLRTFQESFGMPPKRYLMLRELHAVRRSLRDGAAHAENVADVLTRHGIWEFGRFAARYRRHFGEPPSETLRRSRA